MKKSLWWVVLLLSLLLAITLVAGCTPQDTDGDEVTGSVGIVLPTKEEPRWIQDETRFKDLLTEAGYKVEILFSEGDSAKEKENVESLITKGIEVLIICPHDGSGAAAAGSGQGSRGQGDLLTG